MGRDTEGRDTPENSAELLPKRLYVAEVLMIPFFWFSPLLVLVLGGTMALDVKRLNRRYGVEFSDLRYLFYLTPFAIGHLGSLAYRTQRREQILRARGFEPSMLARLRKRRGTGQNYVLAGWFLLQLVTILTLAVVPAGRTAAVDVLAAATVLVIAGNVIAGPALVWWDLRSVRDIEHVSWGWPRYLHVLVSALPCGIFIYLIQRSAHIQCALIVELWDEDPEDYRAPDADKGRLEKLNDRLGAMFR